MPCEEETTESFAIEIATFKKKMKVNKIIQKYNKAL